MYLQSLSKSQDIARRLERKQGGTLLIGSLGQRDVPHLISFLAVVTGKVGSSPWEHILRGNKIVLLA